MQTPATSQASTRVQCGQMSTSDDQMSTSAKRSQICAITLGCHMECAVPPSSTLRKITEHPTSTRPQHAAAPVSEAQPHLTAVSTAN
jgi:hypothetical protein